MEETTEFWRHPRFRDLGLLKARFTRHRYDRHTHPTYVVALITDGCERIRIGNRNVVAPIGTVAVVNPEEWHDGQSGAEGGWAYRTLYPSIPLLRDIARELGRDEAPLFSPDIIDDAGLARAIALAHTGATREDVIGAEMSMLIALRRLILNHSTCSKPPEQIEASGARHRLSIYEDLIGTNFASDLDLQSLASAAGVTRFQVIRDFKKVTGVTPGAFIRNWKLRRACFLIEQGSSLAAAALEAGFADQSHLSRTFRAGHGITPGMFKKAG